MNLYGMILEQVSQKKSSSFPTIRECNKPSQLHIHPRSVRRTYLLNILYTYGPLSHTIKLIKPIIKIINPHHHPFFLC